MSSSSSSPFKDYFSILGIEITATEEEIKIAYRELAFKFHPDRNSSPEAHEQFLLVGEAYHVLTNPDQKRRYLNRYQAAQPKADQERLKNSLQHRQEMNRMKRSDRYRSGRYSQRVRYRGASSSSNRPSTPWEKKRPATPPRRPSSYSTADIESEVESSQIGFKYYSWLMSLIALLLILLCSGMWTDFYLTQDLGSETVKGKKRSSEIFVAMNGMKIKTTRHTFLIHGEEARKFPKGREVTLMKSPYGDILTHVKVMEGDFQWKFNILDGPYGVHFWMTYVVAFFSLLTILLKNKYQSSAYVGTINILLALSMLSMVFTT